TRIHAARVGGALRDGAARHRAGGRARHALDTPAAGGAAGPRPGDARPHPARDGAGAVSFTVGVVLAVLALGLPALAFALWPLRHARGAAALLPLPPDARERLAED